MQGVLLYLRIKCLLKVTHELNVMNMHFVPIPGWISRCPQRAVSHNDNVILLAVFKQLWLSEIGMAFNLCLKKINCMLVAVSLCTITKPFFTSVSCVYHFILFFSPFTSLYDP